MFHRSNFCYTNGLNIGHFRMRALKALVVVLTLLLLVGFAGLIWGIMRQAGKLAEPPETPASMAPAVVADERTPWQPLLLNEPAGTRIANVTSAGDLVVLHLYTGAAGQDERLVIIDPGNGVRLGTVVVTARP